MSAIRIISWSIYSTIIDYIRLYYRIYKLFPPCLKGWGPFAKLRVPFSIRLNFESGIILWGYNMILGLFHLTLPNIRGVPFPNPIGSHKKFGPLIFTSRCSRVSAQTQPESLFSNLFKIQTKYMIMTQRTWWHAFREGNFKGVWKTFLNLYWG